jgi:multidrug efflux pump subunit AcrA (membrane-fusion protein)
MPLQAAAILIAVGLTLGAIRWARSAPKLPVADARQIEFVDYVEVRGQVKALRSEMVTAPASAGELQILKIAANGAKVNKGDVLVQFDASTLQQKYAQDRSTLKSAEAEIEQARAAGRLKEEQDLTDAMRTRFDTESARMDASKEEILSAIDGAEAKLKVADAEQKQMEAEARLRANRSAGSANLHSREKKRDEAAFEVKQDEAALGSMVLRAPLDGVVVLQGNWRASGPMPPATPFKAGDRAWPGAALIELPDPSTLRINGRIDEGDRGRLRLEQHVSVKVDALTDSIFSGKVDEISATASLDFNGGWPFRRNFTVGIALDGTDSRLTSDMGAVARVAVERVPGAIVIPVAAIFRKGGQSVVYVHRGSRFEEQPVEVARRSGEDALIAKGLSRGEQVALKDPTATE